MSRLDELIFELCSDGVEFKELQSVIISLNTGLNPRKFFKLNTEDATNYYVTIREMRGGKIIFSERTDKINDNALKLCNNRSNLEIGDVLFSGTGTIGETVVIDKEPNNWNIKEGVYAIKPNPQYISSLYLSHLLGSSSIKQVYMKKVAGGTVKSIPMVELKKLKIPVPPLEVQNEIVRLLDRFKVLTTELTVGLSMELAERKQQYRYYLNSFFENQIDNRVSLESIGTLTRGKRFVHADVADTGVPCIHYGELYTYYGVHADTVKSHIREELRSKMRYAHKGDVIIVGAGENNIDIGVGVAWEGDEDVAVHDACYILCHSQDSKYISYYLRSDMYHNQIKKYVSEGKICSISASGLGKAMIPIPSISEQKRIVSILERFDILCNDITKGILVEIDGRCKQFEYYRDQLLTFGG